MQSLELNQRFFEEAVQPALAGRFPRLVYGAALVGWGSEVLGYDDAWSRDHGWGPGFQLFLSAADLKGMGSRIKAELSLKLPGRFAGFSTHFSKPDRWGIRYAETHRRGPVRHRIELVEPRAYFKAYLGCDPGRMSERQWLACPQQKLLTCVSGRVFRDDHGRLKSLRSALSYFPHPVWVYLLRAQWFRIGQEEAYVERLLHAGDRLGARLVLGRLCQDLIRLSFLIERRYWPYQKWLARAFSELTLGRRLAPMLERALGHAEPAQGLRRWHQCIETVCAAFNELGLVAPVNAKVCRLEYLDRPCRAIDGYAISAALEPLLRRTKLGQQRFRLGSLDQVLDWADEASNPDFCREFQRIYG